MRVKIDHDGCWLWEGAVDRHGYGIVNLGGKPGNAHRAVYALFVGKIPQGHHVHHVCGMPACVNPAHLEAHYPGEHHRLHHPRHDMCIWGHPFDEANTYITRKGERQCRKCKARRERERQSRLRDAAKHRPLG